MNALVVLVNWRQPQMTMRAAQSLVPQLAADDRLVIVDNGSGDDSVQVMTDAGFTVLPVADNRGFGSGVNAAARTMTEDLLILLNNDAVAQPGFIDAFKAAFTEPGSERLGAASAHLILSGLWRPATAADAPDTRETARDGAQWVRVDAAAAASGRGHESEAPASSTLNTATAEDAATETASTPREATEGPETHGVQLTNSTGNQVDASGNGYDRDWLTPTDHVHADRQVFGFCGGACALRKEALDQVGLFREDLFMYYEDTELSWRLRKAFWDIAYQEQAVAIHEHAASSGSHSDMFIRVNTRNRLIVATLHGPAHMVVNAWGRTIS